MQTRLLGNSDLHLTPIGFGAWAIGGGDWQFGWGAQDDTASIQAIHRALELGINWIDTAPVYGLGHSEEIVAQALSSWSGPKPFLFTKGGMTWNDQRQVGYSTKAASIQKEVEDSLRRLQVEAIDLYQIHWPADDLKETAEGWTTMAKLQKEGKIRWLGACNFSLEELRQVQSIARVTALQPPYSLIRRDVELELMPYCQKENIGLIVYSPMASGLLSGAMTRERALSLPANDWRSRSPEFKEPNLSLNLALVDRLKTIGQQHGRTAGEVAIAWTLRRPEVTGAIVGARNAQQVAGFVGAASLTLTPEEIRMIDIPA